MFFLFSILWVTAMTILCILKLKSWILTIIYIILLPCMQFIFTSPPRSLHCKMLLITRIILEIYTVASQATEACMKVKVGNNFIRWSRSVMQNNQFWSHLIILSLKFPILQGVFQSVIAWWASGSNYTLFSVKWHGRPPENILEQVLPFERWLKGLKIKKKTHRTL